MKKIMTLLVPLLAAVLLSGCYYDPYWYGPHPVAPPPYGRIMVPMLPPPGIFMPPPAIIVHP
jgi:hypothetical protein